MYNPETEQIQLVAKPIKYASIEIYDEEPYPLPAANLKDWGLLEGPLYTDNNGYFEVTVKDNNDGWLENGRDIFVVCKAETDLLSRLWTQITMFIHSEVLHMGM